MSESAGKTSDQPGPSSGSEHPAPEVDGKGIEFLDRLAEQQAEFSNEDIDQFLQQQDPEFAGQLGEIQKDSALSATEDEIDADTAALHDEIERWRTSRGIKRSLYLVLPFLPRVWLWIKRLAARMMARVRAFRLYLQSLGHYLITEGRRSAQAWLLAKIKILLSGVTAIFGDFGRLSLKLKLALVGLLVLFIASGALLLLTWKGQLLPKEKELFLTDLAAHASEVYEVKEDEGFENFYDNIRSTPNLLLIPRLLMNLKPSGQSGRNPMVACELFLEGLNPDVILEVKDRESFFKDLMQRTTEDFSFDELSTTEGKKRYELVLLKEINRNLTTGELRNIRIKTIVLKP